MKYFRFTRDEVLWSISFVNLNMLLATIPDLSAGKKKEEKVEGSEETTLLDVFKEEI